MPRTNLPEPPLRPSWIRQILEDILEHVGDINDLTPLVKSVERCNSTKQIVKAVRSLSEEKIAFKLRDTFNQIYSSNVAVTVVCYEAEFRDASFTRFGELPTELHDIIWSQALPVERIFKVMLHTSSFERSLSCTRAYDSLQTNSKAINAQILHLALACRGSNEIVRKKYKSIAAFGEGLQAPSLTTRKTLVDYDSDVFYFHDLVAFSDGPWRIPSDQTALFREKYHCFRRIACPPKALNCLIAFHVCNGFNTLPPFVEALKNLEELIVIPLTWTSPALAPPLDAPLCFVPNSSIEISEERIINSTRSRWESVAVEGGPLEQFKNVKLTFREMKYDYVLTISQRLEHYAQMYLIESIKRR